MHVITISGSRSGVGKTTLAEILLSRLTGFAAIKVTVTDFFVSVTDDPEVTGEEGKDTALMKGAGAEAVVWVRSTVSELPECLAYAFNLVGNARGVVVEGNSPARALKADFSFFVTGADLSEAKQGALEMLARADAVVVNLDEDEPPGQLAGKIRGLNKSAVITTMRRMRGTDPGLEEFFRRFGY